MRKLILDVAKWRCGGQARDPTVKLGAGVTLLKNREGFMCCLGQFAHQIIGDSESLYNGEPCEIAEEQKRNYDKLFVKASERIGEAYTNTKLAKDLMSINDDPHATIAEKLKAIKEMLAKYGVELLVLNGEVYRTKESS